MQIQKADGTVESMNFDELAQASNDNKWNLAALSYVWLKKQGMPADQLANAGFTSEQIRQGRRAWSWAINKGYATDIDLGSEYEVPKVDYMYR